MFVSSENVKLAGVVGIVGIILNLVVINYLVIYLF